jgi:AraC-like DNA-binding protein
MLLSTHIPQMPLAMFVDYFWYVQGYNPAHSKELALPDGSVEVVIDLREDTIRLFDSRNRELNFGSSILCGPHSDYFVIDTACESRVIGIHFKPGGIHAFVKEPLDEILNVHISLHTIWGSRVSEIRDELLASLVPDEMFRVLERRLLSLATKDLERHPAVQFVLSNLHDGQIAEIIEQIGISHRRFNEIFKHEVGMTPKRLSRIYRFQEVLRSISDGKKISWTDIALACGYYDQAHFVKDFQSFSGINPSDYRPISGRHHNHAEFSK